PPLRDALPLSGVRRPVSAGTKGTGAKRRPSRESGTAPRTCAIVIASIIAAPAEALPVSGRAIREKAMGAAACGTAKVPYEPNQRSRRDSGRAVAGAGAGAVMGNLLRGAGERGRQDAPAATAQHSAQRRGCAI